MNVARFFGYLSFFVSYGRKSGNIVNIARFSDVSFDCMLGWVVELNGSGCGLQAVGASRFRNLRFRKKYVINY